IAGHMQADEMAELLGISLPERRDYETVAGFVLSHLHHLPETGESVDAPGWRFEVVDLDGRRIDKIIARRPTATRRERVRSRPATGRKRKGRHQPPSQPAAAFLRRPSVPEPPRHARP